MPKNDDNAANNNPNTTTNGENIISIGGRSFRKTKFGLAEDEVRAYIGELVNQRDALVKGQEHLKDLNELAQKTVIDANNISRAIAQKVIDQAKTEAQNLHVKAEQQAEEFLKTVKAQAKTAAEKAAAEINADVSRQVKVVREQQLADIQSEAANLAQKLQNDLIAYIENMKKNVASLSTKYQSVELGKIELVKNVRGQNVIEAGNDKTVNMAAKVSDGEKGVSSNPVPWLEIELMPPMDIEKTMDLISELEKMPAVKTTDLLPETPNPLIRVFLNKPLPLAENLRKLPHIAQVTESVGSNGDNGQSGDKRGKIQVVFGTHPQYFHK
jgi:cell division septum initiation protein DivIVA